MVGCRILAAVFLSATLGVTMARAQEPVDVLAKNGLTKSGTFFVIASEDPVMQKLYNLRPVMGQMEQRYMAVAAGTVCPKRSPIALRGTDARSKLMARAWRKVCGPRLPAGSIPAFVSRRATMEYKLDP